jgi:hypothetical protein
MDNKYSFENKKIYSEREALLPETDVNYAIRKILLIEKIFQNEEVSSIRPTFSLFFDASNNIFFEQDFLISWKYNSKISNSLHHDINNILEEIKVLDKAFANFYILNNYYNYENDAYIKEKIEREMIEKMNNLLVNSTYHRYNRFDLYTKDESFIDLFNENNRKYFKEYIETLRENKNYISPKIEIYGEEFALIPVDFNDFQVTDIGRMKYYKKQFYFEEIKEFIIESFDNLYNNAVQNSSSVEKINMTIDSKNQNISSVYIDNENHFSLLNYSTKILPCLSDIKEFSIELEKEKLKESLEKNLTDIFEFTKIKNHDTNISQIANEIEILINKKVLNSVLSEKNEINNKIYKNRL